MYSWWPILGLLSWCPILKSSLCNSYGDWVSIDLIYRCLIFRWFVETLSHDMSTRIATSAMAARPHAPCNSNTLCPSMVISQCSKLDQKSCQSCCLESQIINIKLKKSFRKFPGPPPKLSASGWRTGSNLEHWISLARKDRKNISCIPWVKKCHVDLWHIWNGCVPDLVYKKFSCLTFEILHFSKY